MTIIEITVHINDHYSFVVVVKTAIFFKSTYMVSSLHKHILKSTISIKRCLARTKYPRFLCQRTFLFIAKSLEILEIWSIDCQGLIKINPLVILISHYLYTIHYIMLVTKKWNLYKRGVTLRFCRQDKPVLH